MTGRRWLSGILALVGACARTADGPISDAAGPSLVRLAPVRVEEPGDLPIGNFTFLSRGADGSSFVTDVDRGRVVQFSPVGGLVGVLGRPGSGPGELRLPAATGVVAGSLLAVSDIGLRRLTLFSLVDRSFVRLVPLPVQDVGQGWTRRGDTVIFAAHLARAMVVRWSLETDSMVTLGTTPARLLTAMPITIRHGRSEVVPTTDGYLAQLPTEPGLEILDRSGRLVGFVTIPWRDRRGDPDDLFDRQRRRIAAAGATPFQPVGSLSAGLHRLATGELAAVYLDVDQASRDRPTDFINYRYYVSLLSPDLSQACVDARVPVAGDLLSLPAFQGDSLFVFSRTVTDDDRVRSEILGFGIDDAGCRWVPTGGVRAPRL